MKIFNQYRRKARIVTDVQDYNVVLNNPNDPDFYRLAMANEEMPIHYTVKVQIKVAFVWVTIWSESTDFSDGDSRTYINHKAKELCKLMEGEENG